MAESYTEQQQLVKEQNRANPSKYSTNFLYKALTVILFLVIIPVFPSRAPEFINQTLLDKTWELIHLLFVGIAVSYGLFSRLNDETEKEQSNNQSKFDNVQSLASGFLQVSPVFDDDQAENLSGTSDHETTKVQTWSNQYYRNEPPVVVVKELGEKPLLLPVRSLKSRVLNEKRRANSGFNHSSLSSKRFSDDGHGESKGLLDEKIVLPSPIPWRSRSGRMEMKEDVETRSFRSQSARFSRSNSKSSSPKKPLEAEAKSAEDSVTKKCILRSPPPPPPPPPPPMIQKPSNPSLKPVNHGKAVRLDQISLRTEPEPRFMEFPQEEKRGTVEEEEDDESESEGSAIETRRNSEEGNESSGNDGGSSSDVDKKADEFIAKVREQIRLQRIDSIKRSTGQFKRNSTG